MTTRIPLPIEIAHLPASNPAVYTANTASSAGATTNCPVPRWGRMELDKDTDQTFFYTLRVPSDWLSGATLVVTHGSAVNAGNVVLKGGLAIDVHGSTSWAALAYLAADLSAVVAVPGTIGQTKETSWALTTTGLTAGMLTSIFVGRDADNGSDNAAGTSYIYTVELDYSS